MTLGIGKKTLRLTIWLPQPLDAGRALVSNTLFRDPAKMESTLGSDEQSFHQNGINKFVINCLGDVISRPLTFVKAVVTTRHAVSLAT